MKEPDSALRLAGVAWSFRCAVERDAEARFARLAGRLSAAGFPPSLVALARRASADERRHAALCAEEARRRGAPIPDPPAGPPSEIAPAGLDPDAAALYEVVAASCVTETESCAVLQSLLACVRDRQLKGVLRELARDEVQHARLGWACLAHAHRRGAAGFLGPLVPFMLAGAAPPDLFQAVERAREDPALLEHGVLPHAMKRDVFLRTLEDVVFPGLAGLGVDPAPSRAWLDRASQGGQRQPVPPRPPPG